MDMPKPIGCSHRFQDLTGQVFGRLTVLGYAGKGSSGRTSWHCRCTCGEVIVAKGNALKSGHYSSKCNCVSCHPIERAFWSRVAKSDGCWEWQGTLGHKGYGVLKYKGKMVYAHRLSYELHKGPLPDGMCACHHCDNPRCVNPDHLFAGTKAENCNDRHRKGRTPSGERTARAVLTAEKALEIRSLSDRGVDRSEIARQYGVTKSAVVHIIHRRSWKNIESSGQASS